MSVSEFSNDGFTRPFRLLFPRKAGASHQLAVLVAVLAMLGLLTAALAQSGRDDRPSRGGGFGAPGSPFGAPQPAQPEEVVTIEAQVSRKSVAPGDNLTFVAIMNFAEGWHAWPAAEQNLLPPEIASWAIGTTAGVVDAPEWLLIGPIQWPDAKPTQAAGVEELLPTYGGRAPIFIPAFTTSEAPVGEHTITLRVGWQACDDFMCEPPTSADVTVTIRVVPAGTAIDDQPTPGIFDGFDPAVFANLDKFGDGTASLLMPGGEADAGRSFFGLRIPAATDPVGIAVIALLAALGGAILNLTPCVLPVIPLKIMTISAHAGAPGKSLVLGLWMAVGVIAFWAFLGVIAASFSAFADPSRLFGIWWITVGIGVLIGAMGVGIMGAFEIRLPKAVYAVNPKADSPMGSFLFGVMTAVLGLPCFGFVAGALLAGSATLPWGVVLTIFAALGVGMAAPYLVLSAFPSMVKKIPRTGPASELVKQVMGLLLMAAAAYFVGSGIIALLGGSAGLPWWGKSIHWWFVALFAIAAGGWLALKTVQISKKTTPRVAFGFVGLILAGGGLLAAADRTNDAYHNIWVPYSEQALADARAAGRVVVMDFTAEWCLNCKALKAAVLSQPPIKPLLQSGGIIPMTVDLTSTDAPGWDKLRSLGQTGIPLLVIYGPETGDTPWMANNYTAGMVLRGIAAARGQTVDELQDAVELESAESRADN